MGPNDSLGYMVIVCALKIVEGKIHLLTPEQPPYRDLCCRGRELRSDLAETPQQQFLVRNWVERLRQRKLKKAMRPGFGPRTQGAACV